MKSSNFIKNIKNVNGITIVKLLLCLYILFVPHINNKTLFGIAFKIGHDNTKIGSIGSQMKSDDFEKKQQTHRKNWTFFA